MFNISNKSSIYCIPNIKPIYSITDIISIIETDYYCQDQIKKLFKENKCTYDKFLNHDNIADKHNKQISSGTYFYVLKTENHSISKKMLLLK